MSNQHKLAALAGRKNRHHQRTLNALLALLDMVTADGDPNDVDSIDHAEDLLVGLGRAIDEGRSARMRQRSEEKLKTSRTRDRERLAADAERARILNEAPSNQVLLEELNQARAAGDTDRARNLERAILGMVDASPALIDPDQKARDKQAALDKRERERAGMAPPAKVEPAPLDADTQRAIDRVREMNRANRAGKAKAPTAPATSTESEE